MAPGDAIIREWKYCDQTLRRDFQIMFIIDNITVLTIFISNNKTVHTIHLDDLKWYYSLLLIADNKNKSELEDVVVKKL